MQSGQMGCKPIVMEQFSGLSRFMPAVHAMGVPVLATQRDSGWFPHRRIFLHNLENLLISVELVVCLRDLVNLLPTAPKHWTTVKEDRN